MGKISECYYKLDLNKSTGTLKHGAHSHCDSPHSVMSLLFAFVRQ